MSRPERLSALDSTFIFMESKTAPSHAGFLSILDGPLDFETFRSDLMHKLPLVDRFRQRVQRAPLNLAHPAWVTAQDFDIDEHVHHVEFDPPIPVDQADKVFLDIYHRGLDQRKPLWAIHVINGIEGGRSAIVHEMHHCIVDGASAMLLGRVLYDFGPVSEDELSSKGELPPPPNVLQSFWHAVVDDAVSALAILKRSPESILRTLRAVRTPAFREGLAALREANKAPSIRFPFNGPPSGRLSIAKTLVPFDLMRELGAKHGGTINDVLLAIITGGVMRYAEECGLDVSGQYFKFQMPTNVRMPDQNGQLGTVAAAAPVHVRLDIADPVERLKAVIECTSKVKRLKIALGLSHLIRLIQIVMTPPGLILSEKLYGSRWVWLLEKKLKPRSAGTNMFVTNVPRPRMPFYICGREILHGHALVPLLPNQGMVCGAITHNQNLAISYTGDAAVQPGTDALMRYTEDALDELVRASGCMGNRASNEHTGVETATKFVSPS